MSNVKNTQPTNAPSNNETGCNCPYCQRRFASIDQLTLHVVTRHTWNGKDRKAEPAVSGK